MIIRSIVKAGLQQFQTLFNVLAGYPLTYPPLTAGTLDKDDVVLARQWLQDQASWEEAEETQLYEQEFADWNDSAFAYAFMGGRVALSACIYALDLKPGDEIIIPGYTCIVVPNAFSYAGVKVCYSDIELDTYGLDADILQSRITSRTKAVMLQHLYGLVCRDYEHILDIAMDNNLWVIEDCAHAAGAEYKGRKVGNYGHIAFYSSEQSKIFTTIQGGIAVTNDTRLAAGLQEYSDGTLFPDRERIVKQLYNIILNYYQFKHPARWLVGDWVALIYGKHRLISTTRHEKCGIQPACYRMKMPAPIAAIGRNQLRKLDSYNQQRRQAAKRWESWTIRNGYTPPLVIEDSVPVFLRYPVLVESEKKENLSWALKKLKVKPGVWFLSNVHPADRKVYGCPNADAAVKKCINFPTLFY